MNNENLEQNEIFDDEMLPEYDFTNGIQGKHDQAYRQGHTVTIYKEDGTTIVQHFDKIVTQRQNIFTINYPVSPERFVGRSKLIETAFDQICNRSHLAVWEGPGMGKSSFLQLFTESQVWQLRGLNPSQAVIILLKCESIQPFNTANFWQNILELLKYQIDSIPSLQLEIESLLQKENNTIDDLVKVLRLLGEHNKFLVLLVDDYDLTLFTNEQYTEADIKAFVSQCRYLAYSVPERKYLSMIVTSSRRLFEIGLKLAPGHSPWYNHYLFRQLKPFNDGEVEALLTGIPITPALKAGIRKIADGNPFYYKLPQISQQELAAMFGTEDLRKTRFAQEMREEGRTEGEMNVKFKTVSRLLKQGLSVEEIAEILELDSEQVRQVAQNDRNS